MPLIVALFGLSKTKTTGIAKDGKVAGWVGVVVALLGVGYVATFFGSWLLIAALWFGLQLAMIVGILVSPTAEA